VSTNAREDCAVPAIWDAYLAYGLAVATDQEIGFPAGDADERELFLSWLRYLRGAVLRNLDRLGDEQAR